MTYISAIQLGYWLYQREKKFLAQVIKTEREDPSSKQKDDHEMSSIYKKMTDPEREVARYLKKRDLWWIFEFPVFAYDEKDRPRLWTPDFYIPKLGLYIEVCGSEEFDYEYRKEIYEKNGIPVVFLHYYKRPRKWKSFLAKKVEEIEQQRKTEAKKLANFFKL